jgi:hypothetical protein
LEKIVMSTRKELLLYGSREAAALGYFALKK